MKRYNSNVVAHTVSVNHCNEIKQLLRANSKHF